MTYQGNHTIEVVNGIKIGFILFIITEIFFFLSIFWAYLHAALAPTIELGSMWPPIGIESVNPFGIPLLNTVENAINNFYINEAVWMKIPLYMLNLSKNSV